MKSTTQTAGIKIQELAARTGVSKPTIHFYVEKGLLPRPTKVNRTMAYYDESCVEQIRLIREFQEKAFLPLGRIKRLFDTIRDTGMLQNILSISTHYAGWLTDTTPPRTVSEAEVMREFGFSQDRLSQLERLGVLTPETKKGRKVYHVEDIEILKVLARMTERGFTPRQGWPTEALTIYVDAASGLAEKEVAQLFDRIEKGLDPEDAQNLFNNTGEDIFLSLLLWMRRRSMRKEFGKRVRRMKTKE